MIPGTNVSEKLLLFFWVCECLVPLLLIVFGGFTQCSLVLMFPYIWQLNGLLTGDGHVGITGTCIEMSNLMSGDSAYWMVVLTHTSLTLYLMNESSHALVSGHGFHMVVDQGVASRLLLFNTHRLLWGSLDLTLGLSQWLSYILVHFWWCDVTLSQPFRNCSCGAGWWTDVISYKGGDLQCGLRDEITSLVSSKDHLD